MVPLVGGWTNPFEKYERQIGFIFPKFGMKTKNISNHHPVMVNIGKYTNPMEKVT